MPLLSFDHVNIRTSNIDAMIAWYDDVLGIKQGHRPAFANPGAWLYLGDACVVHLVDLDTPPTPYRDDENIRLEHFAFRASGYADFTANLDAHGIAYTPVPADVAGTVLVFLRDPDGNAIHVDFPLSEMA
ncbi:MAG: VOC family protein [Pseudomonadota bacterium]